MAATSWKPRKAMRADRGCQAPAGQQGWHGLFNAFDALVGGIDALEIFFEDGFHGGMGQDQFAQVAQVGLTPIGFALVTVAVAQEETFEAQAAAAQIIDGIGAGAAEVADGFIGGFGDIDGDQFAGAQQAGDGAGVAFIGFEGRAGRLGMREGAATRQGTSSCLRRRAIPKPQGPAS